ncbi:Uncharacterized protein FWK35_00019129, partial [Aphis craccivora]
LYFSFCILRGHHTTHVLYQFYKWVAYRIYVQKIMFSSVSLKIRVNRPIIHLDGKDIICVCMLVF